MNNRLPQLLQFYEEDPSDEFILFALAQEYQKSGDLAQALHFYQILYNSSPSYVGTYYHLAKLHLQLQSQASAIDTLKEGIKVAQAAQDHHALAELQNLLLNVELGLDED
jgi:tetratricopeptide (TPR) repeat protein